MVRPVITPTGLREWNAGCAPIPPLHPAGQVPAGPRATLGWLLRLRCCLAQPVPAGGQCESAWLQWVLGQVPACWNGRGPGDGTKSCAAIYPSIRPRATQHRARDPPRMRTDRPAARMQWPRGSGRAYLIYM